jgi:hypothetical protein
MTQTDQLDKAFYGLLGELAGRWPQRDLDYVRDEVAHAEYGDALENLIALGLENDR